MKFISLAQNYLLKKTKKDSFDAHNSEFLVDGKIEAERLVHKEYQETNIFNGDTLRFHDIIDQNPGINIAFSRVSREWYGNYESHGLFLGKMVNFEEKNYWYDSESIQILSTCRGSLNWLDIWDINWQNNSYGEIKDPRNFVQKLYHKSQWILYYINKIIPLFIKTKF